MKSREKVFLVDNGETKTKHEWTPSQVAKKSDWVKSAARAAEALPGQWVAFGLFCIKQTWTD